jgi:hypothetical protein
MSAMGGRCNTCRWWSIGGFDQWGTCLLTATNNAKPIYPQTIAVAYAKDEDSDTTTDPSELVTSPDFGCVQWEAGKGPQG